MMENPKSFFFQKHSFMALKTFVFTVFDSNDKILAAFFCIEYAYTGCFNQQIFIYSLLLTIFLPPSETN